MGRRLVTGAILAPIKKDIDIRLWLSNNRPVADVMNRGQRDRDGKVGQALDAGAVAFSSHGIVPAVAGPQERHPLAPVDRQGEDTMHDIRLHGLADEDAKALLMADLKYSDAAIAACDKHLDGRTLDHETAHALLDKAEDIDKRLCELCDKLAKHLHARTNEAYCDTHQANFVECDWCHEWVDAEQTTTVEAERHVDVVCRPCYEVGQGW